MHQANWLFWFDTYFDDSDQPVAYGAYPPELGESPHFFDDNSADDIYWNDVHMTTCEINQDLYTYNTGVMMQVEIALYEITENSNHLQETKYLANGAYSVFTRIHEGKRFFPARDPWFHAKLLQGYLDLYKHDKSANVFINIFIGNANHAWEHARNDIYLFYEDWTGNDPGRDEWLLNQASVLEVLGLIALYKNESVF